MKDKFNLKEFLNKGSFLKEIEEYETLYDVIAKKIGYQDSKQMVMNEDEINNQTKILANWICELNKQSPIFYNIKE